MKNMLSTHVQNKLSKNSNKMDIKPSIYLEDTFEVIHIDKEGKKFERCSRIEAKS